MKERIKQQSSYVIHYYGMMLLLGMIFHKLIGKQFNTEPIIVVILASYIIVFPIVFFYTRKYALQIFLFCLAFISGFYSFYQYSVEDHSILNALYFTFQLFLLVTTDVFTTDGSTMLQYPVILEIARWSAALYTISTLFLAMYRMLEMSILQEVYQMIGGHYVVIGYNDSAIALIKDLKQRKKRIVVVANKISPADIDRLEEEKIVVISSHLSNAEIYAKCGLLRARAIVLFHDHDFDNLNELLDLKAYVHKQQLKTTVFIHLKSTKSIELLAQLEEGLQENGECFPFRLEVRNMYKLFAERLLEEHEIVVECDLQSTKESHLLFVGFGLMGQYLALEAIQQSSNIKSYPLHVTALDKNMPIQQEKWLRGTVNLDFDLSFYEFDVEADDINAFLQKQSVPVTHLFICLHEAYLDFTAGIELANRYPNLSIYMQMTKGGMLDKWLELGVAETKSLYSSGEFKDVLTEEIFLKVD